MANIRVDLGMTVHDGMDVVFRTPCDCSEVTGIIIYYPKLNGTMTSKVFALKDAHNNDVSNLSELFASGVLIKALLDVTNGYAYIQNADTNGYIEGKIGMLSIYNVIVPSSNMDLSTSFKPGWNFLTKMLSQLNGIGVSIPAGPVYYKKYSGPVQYTLYIPATGQLFRLKDSKLTCDTPSTTTSDYGTVK